jgi:sialic acid synthase SpsE
MFVILSLKNGNEMLKNLFENEGLKARNNPIIKPYIIAEAGVNHEGDMDTAFRLIAEAREGGADAIKFQTYKASTIVVKNSPSYWDLTKEPTDSQYKLFQKYDKFWKNEFQTLARRCEEEGIEFMSTPFDKESAFFINELVSTHKISSSDITNRPFIELIATFGKPILLSTGASHLYEIQEAISWVEEKDIPLCLMHCVLNYPTPNDRANLARINGLKSAFPHHVIGYSDHTLPEDMQTCMIAGMLGATIIEKHFTHDKGLTGNDHYHAMDKEDLKKFIALWAKTETLLGSTEVTTHEAEEKSRKYARRSLVANCPIRKGETIIEEMLTWKRPALGISPAEHDDLLGKKALVDIAEDTILHWNMFETN